MADHTYKASEADEADASALVGDVDAWFAAQASALFAQCREIVRQRRFAAAGVASTASLTAAEVEALCAPREAKIAADNAAAAAAAAAEAAAAGDATAPSGMDSTVPT